MELDLEVRGLDDAEDDVEEMARSASDLTPPMQANAEQLRFFISQRFATRTAPDGSAWPPLKGPSESTGALATSAYAIPSTDGVAYGASAPHAPYQHADRPFLPTDEDAGPAEILLTSLEEAIADHIVPE